jgi:hypothetical protein
MCDGEQEQHLSEGAVMVLATLYSMTLRQLRDQAVTCTSSRGVSMFTFGAEEDDSMFDDLITRRSPPPNRVGMCDGEQEQHL